jgi:hypothetical protein
LEEGRIVAEIAKEIASGKVIGRDYHIHVRTGVVESTETRAETEVSGNISGGGGYSSGGYGSSNPVSGSIESKTTRFQNIFLKDEDGDDHVIELVDFLVPCKAGQMLSLFIVKSGHNLRGPYFRAYNHNTREHYENPKAVSSEMFPIRKLVMATGGLAALFFLGGLFGNGGGFGNGLLSALIAAVVGGIIFGIAGKIVGTIRGSNVRNNPEFAQFLAALARG